MSLSRKPPFAFTLIELLVTMAIVSTVLALTLPALSSVRRSGRLVSCAAQLRDVGVAMRMYMDGENCGFLPAAPTYYAWDADRSVAFRLLVPYLNKQFGARDDGGRFARNPPFTCPSDRLFWFRHGYSYDYFAGLWMTSLHSATVTPRLSRLATFNYENGLASKSPIFEDLDFRGHTAGLGAIIGKNRLMFDGSVQWKGWAAESTDEPIVARPLDP